MCGKYNILYHKTHYFILYRKGEYGQGRGSVKMSRLLSITMPVLIHVRLQSLKISQRTKPILQPGGN